MKNGCKTICMTLLGTTLICGIGFSAKLYLEPSGGELIANCPNPIQIMLDTEGVTTNTVDVKLIDNKEFEITSISDAGAIFGSYTKSMQAKIRHGKYRGDNAIYLLGTNPGIGRFNGDGIFTTINIVPNNTEQISLDFYVLPNQNGDDSNVSIVQGEKVIDTLDKAIGAQYKITQGKCPIINSGSDNIKDSSYYLDKQENLYELEEKNMLFTVEAQEKIKIQTKLTNKSKLEIFWIKLLNFFNKIFSK